MQENWTPTQSQRTVAQGRQPSDTCGNCAAANMGAVVQLPFGLPAIDFNQNNLLIGVGVIAAAVIGYQLFSGRSAKRRRVASAKADFAKKYADETGRFPSFR